MLSHRSGSLNEQIPRIHKVLCRDGRAIRPGNVPQVEGIRQAIIGDVPGFGNSRLNLAVIAADQALKNSAGHIGNPGTTAQLRVQRGGFCRGRKAEDFLCPCVAPVVVTSVVGADGCTAGKQRQSHCRRHCHSKQFLHPFHDSVPSICQIAKRLPSPPLVRQNRFCKSAHRFISVM